MLVGQPHKSFFVVVYGARFSLLVNLTTTLYLHKSYSNEGRKVLKYGMRRNCIFLTYYPTNFVVALEMTTKSHRQEYHYIFRELTSEYADMKEEWW
jgi:uncharacterized protein Veg